MSEVGRPSELNDELYLKIRDLILEGHSVKSMAQTLEISIGTIDGWIWRNYQGFADRILSYKHERLIQKAESNLEQLLEGEDDKIRADLSKFVLERLQKKNYSSRSELTGAEGKDLPTPILQTVANKDNGTN